MKITKVLDGGRVIGLLQDGTLIAYFLEADGGDRIVYDGRNEKKEKVELEVLLDDTLEAIMPEWATASAEEIYDACFFRWIEARMYR